MKKTNWREIAELIGIAAIVGSLIFVGLQMRQTQSIALNDMSYNRIFSGIDANSTKFEYAELWVRGNANEDLDRAEAMIYKELIRESWNRAFFNNQTAVRLGGASNMSIHDYAYFLYKNPGARKVWEADADERNRHRTLLLGQAPGGIAMQDIVRSDLIKLTQEKL